MQADDWSYREARINKGGRVRGKSRAHRQKVKTKGHARKKRNRYKNQEDFSSEQPWRD